MSALVNIPTPSQFRIGELFHNNNFVVPLYQRNYAWEKEEIEDFWTDLQDLVQGNRSSHFFGQIVTFENDDGVQEIIDGQQRLTTSTIFMAVIKDIANNIYSENFTGAQDESVLEIGDTLRDIRRRVKDSIRGEKGEVSSLMVQNTQDGSDETIQDFFYKLTHGSKSAVTNKTHSEPKQNMQHAYSDIYKWIENYLKNYKQMGERIDKLELIFNSFYNNFYIVMISAPSRKDAFTIFETLNSRGKDLKASDIIKNHLLSLMSEDITTGNEMWNKITGHLDNSSDRITRFIRTYWASKKRIVPESRLYREISAEINDTHDAKSFLEDLDNTVELYTVLESPTSPKAHSEFFDDFRVTEGIDILSRLSVKLYYPVVIAMYYKKYSESDLIKVIYKLTSVFIRHRAIANKGTNKLEGGFSEIAHKIWEYELKNVDEINAEMNEKLMPNNESTEAYFNVLEKEGGQRGAKKWTLMYLLSSLYDAESEDFGNDYYQRVFDDDEFKLIQIDPSDAVGQYSNYIGNWTIIEKNVLHGSPKNAQDTAEYLAKSRLSINRALADKINHIGWSGDSIVERQKEFSNDVINIW